MEEDMSTRGQELGTRLHSGPAGTLLQVEAGRGGSDLGNGRGRTEPIRENPQGLTGMLETSREAKGER